MLRPHPNASRGLAAPVLLIHIEKAAGTTLRELLQRSLFPNIHCCSAAARIPLIYPGFMPGQNPHLTEASVELRTTLLNKTACAVGFLGHFHAVHLLNLLVRVDRGEF